MVTVAHRSDEASAEMEELAKANTNPEEINIGDSDDEDAKIEGVYPSSPQGPPPLVPSCPHTCTYS